MTATGGELIIRAAEASDQARLFEWANDPVTRAGSFSPAPIAWPEHCAWLGALLDDPRRRLYIVSLHVSDTGGAEPVAQVRFDASSSDLAEISVTIAPPWRNRRLAAPVVRLATETFVRETGFPRVRARVKSANEASRRTFLRAGYLDVTGAWPADSDVRCFEFSTPPDRSVG